MRASSRLDQCVTPSFFGGGASVAAKILARSTVRGGPERCSSSSPLTPATSYLARQLITVLSGGWLEKAFRLVGHTMRSGTCRLDDLSWGARRNSGGR